MGCFGEFFGFSNGSGSIINIIFNDYINVGWGVRKVLSIAERNSCCSTTDITWRPENGAKQTLAFSAEPVPHVPDIALDGNERVRFLRFSSFCLFYHLLISCPISAHFQTLSSIHFISMRRSLEKGWGVDLGSVGSSGMREMTPPGPALE